MKQWKSEGLVLRVRPYAESDKMVTLFTLQEGKITAMARGARKTKSKLAAVVDMFIRSEYLLFRGRNMATVQQVSLLESFPQIRQDISLYFYVLYLCELLERVLEENHAVPEIYKLTLETLYALNEGIGDPALVVCAFKLILLKELGYCPVLEECLNCGTRQTLDHFSVSMGGVLCPVCSQSKSSISVSAASIALMRRILDNGLTGVRVVKTSLALKKELSQTLWNLISYNTGIVNIKSRKYLVSD